MNDKQSEIRERYLAGWQARMNPHEVGEKEREIRARRLNIGIALGAGIGLAIGAGFGIVIGNLALGIGFGLSLGVAFGLIIGNKQTRTGQESSMTDDGDGA